MFKPVSHGADTNDVSAVQRDWRRAQQPLLLADTLTCVQTGMRQKTDGLADTIKKKLFLECFPSGLACDQSASATNRGFTRGMSAQRRIDDAQLDTVFNRVPVLALFCTSSCDTLMAALAVVVEEIGGLTSFLACPRITGCDPREWRSRWSCLSNTT